MRYIEKNLSKEIDVGIVAKSIGASRRTLERRFRESAERSIAREIRRLRLMKARRLLLETELLVKQVAQETGFRDAARLHEAFVRTEGVSPSEFRRISRGDGG